MSGQSLAFLLASLKKGNRAAFEAIFDLYEKRLYYFVFSITKSEYATEEILQEVFIKIWTKKETIDLDRSFESFIFTIAKNLTYNYLRNIANQQSLKEEYWKNITSLNEETKDSIILAEYEDIVNDILQQIPTQKRSIYILSKQQGKSNKEIADLLGITQKTVKNHLWKTLQIIRTQLEPHITDSVYASLLGLFLFY
ncbi:RNA polymerase sigma-70 factor [Arenibacter aquaticus]|uniref:RNA polymerase sigma factor n=1 Tax=Arenibacter aquaticus TaxID=2489054 RepID=A0A430K8K0_9FLAO|nr:RNA polymerase sigma-70 factor [Arenibacter aquaticus]RTE55406.1 RNA polymerase sigma-70 factor [Arenibacter aquaticus]